MKSNKDLTEKVSFEQLQYWQYSIQLDPKYNNPIVPFHYTFDAIDYKKVIDIISILVKNIPLFRLSFYESEGSIYQKLANSIRFTKKDYTHTKITKPINSALRESIIAKHAYTIKITDQKLYKITLLESKKSIELFITFHHAIIDLASLKILKKIVSDLLHGENNLKDVTLYNTIDYAQFQRKNYTDRKDSIQQYWEKKIANYIHPKNWKKGNFSAFAQLKTVNTNYKNWLKTNNYTLLETINTSNYNRYIIKIKASNVRNIKNILKLYNLSLNCLVHVAFLLFNPSLNRKDNILIYSPVAYRFNAITKNLIGCCLGCIYVTTPEINYEASLINFCRAIHFQLLQSYNNTIFDFSLINIDSNLLRIQTDLYLNIFLSNTYYSKITNANLKKETRIESKRYYPLNCSVIEQDDGLFIEWVYNEKLYDKDTVILITNYLEAFFSSDISSFESKMKDLFSY